MPAPIKYLNVYRNIKGRYDLMRFLFKWDTDYRKDIIVTLLASVLFVYSALTLHGVYDVIALAVAVAIIMMEFGGEMSILPADYRAAQGGVRYTAQNSLHIAYDELSFLMSGVYPVLVEEALGFENPIAGSGLCKESPLVSNSVDDILMTRGSLPYRQEVSKAHYIRSRHQVRYLAIRVANKLQHTTNGVKLAMYDTAEALVGDVPVRVGKAFYFDSLLTEEAFRSRIFRNNLRGEVEVYADLTNNFPVRKEKIDDRDGVRFMPDFYEKVSGHIGITTLLLTENRRVAMLFQGSNKAVGSNTVALGGSGAIDYADMERAGYPEDLRDVIAYGMARELCEETGMLEWLAEVRENTLVTGFFRWIDRCGKPEFVGITRSVNVPFSRLRAIDGDEVVKYEEIPVTINTLGDFCKVLDYVRDRKVIIALSSLMALHRMTVIAGYGTGEATAEQKQIYQTVSEFLSP